ncbi:alpha/beta fold hydrolase [Novosphingobium album (ex Liu et al. 2023)]|uniref:Alpha/beta fold hydrolase n=1 Tax=Novosphingobium album (ex Liu et al. 2023) TaxID=3031130 RepID=A0ABT5WX17_9SPHN|nr:alpha/beta fold hydrolase [Novosphingobium album (ex Liu et al. 2023)]MDE8654448.1 alpha/beta fold hydrolase [Novosphingobium album (ex Liu et al. 2023)]
MKQFHFAAGNWTRWRRRSKSGLATALGALCLVMPVTSGLAQDFKDLQQPDRPLSLRARGSFYVGGKDVPQTPTQQGGFASGRTDQPGNVAIDQTYVEYMIPTGRLQTPLVLIHGSTLTGKTWDTTPDGRMGWYEYLVRRGYPTYVVDYVGRGRSGFDQSIFNDVRAGVTTPQSLPEIRRFSDAVGWTNFRFGPQLGTAFPGERFPVQYANRLAKQSIADLDAAYQTTNFTIQTEGLARLAGDLGGAVLIGHSQGALFPTEVALKNPAGVKAIVLLESCSNEYSDAQIKVLAKIPLLSIWGDNLDNPTGIAGWSWRFAYDQCQALTKRLKAAGGVAENIYLPDQGIHGNSHMLMMDDNSLGLADMVIKWLKNNVK